MILVHGSAWAEFDRASGSAVDHRLAGLIDDHAPLAVTEPVMMEVLSAARDEEAGRRLRRLLLSFDFLPLDPVADFDGAAHLRRRCRQSGVTPRSPLDCLVVSVAWRHGAALLAHDPMVSRVAAVAGVALDEGSLQA